MVARYNPDVDPTRLQPYGNPHAREVTTETEAETSMRKEVAKDMAGEGDSAEELKAKGGPRKRGTKPEGTGTVRSLKGHKGLWVDDAGRVLREDGTVEAVLASPSLEPESKAEAAGVRESEANDPDNDPTKAAEKQSDSKAKERATTDPGTRAEADNVKENPAQGSNVTAAGKEPDSVEGKPKVDVSDTKP